MTNSPVRAFSKFLRVSGPLALAVSAFLVTSQGHARQRCTTKPAVCMRLKAAAAAQAKRAKPAAKAKSNSFKRCTTKPAVCQRLRLSKGKHSKAVKPKRLGSKRCTTKPAVCTRLGRRR